MVAPGQNSANYGSTAIWSGAARPTTVGTNGGPSYYGTYDQNGNVSEIVHFTGTSAYAIGNNYSDTNIGILTSSNNLGTSSVGFRLAAKEYTDVRVSSSGHPKFFIPNSGVLNYSFYVNNYDTYTVTGLQISGYASNINNYSWSANYDTSSSGSLSGTGNILINCDLGANSGYVIINISGNPGSGFIFSDNIMMMNNSYDLQQKYYTISSKISTSSVLISNNYEDRFSNLNWQNISPNSFIVVDDYVPVSDAISSPYFYNSATNNNFLETVPYSFTISKYHITLNEYCEFLNSVDPDGVNPNNIRLGTGIGISIYSTGLIIFNSGNANGFKYSVNSSKNTQPIRYISVDSMCRYCNWLSNGAKSYQISSSGSGAPQNNGSYNIGTGVLNNTFPSGTGLFRLPNLDEIFKASYHKKGLGSGSSISGTNYWSYSIKNDQGVDTSHYETEGLSPQSITYYWPRGNLLGNAAISNSIKSVGINGGPTSWGIFDIDGNVSDIVFTGINSQSKPYSFGTNVKSSTSPSVKTQPIDTAILSTYTNSDSSTFHGFRVVSKNISLGDSKINATLDSNYYNQTSNIGASIDIQHSFDTTINPILITSISGENSIAQGSWVATYYGGASGPSSINSNGTATLSLPIGSKAVFNLNNYAVVPTGVSPITISGSLSNNNTDLLDINSLNNTAIVTSYLDPSTYLYVTTSGNDSIKIDDLLSYTIKVYNTGSSYVKNIYLSTDILPFNNGIAYSWRKDNAGSSSNAVVSISSGIGNISSYVSLYPNTFCSFIVSGTVTDSTYSAINIKSNILVTGYQIGSGEASFITQLAPTDLSIEHQQLPIFYVPSIPINYRIIVSNSSSGNSAYARVVHNPTGIDDINWNISYILSSGVSFGSGNIDTILSMKPGGIATIEVSAIETISSTGIILYSNVQTSGTIIDNNLINNSVISNIPVSVKITNINSSKISCGNNGSIKMSIIGGFPPYSYGVAPGEFSISNEKSFTFKNLPPGVYNPVVKDSTNTYDYFNSIEIIDNTIVNSIDNIYPPTLLDSYGTVIISVAGFGPYSFVFTNSKGDSVSIPQMETKYILSSQQEDSLIQYRFDDLLVPETYSYLILDDYGCSVSGSFEIPNVTPMTAQISVIADNPIDTSSSSPTLDIFDTILIPYKQIRENTNLWKLIKKLSIKDNITILIDNEKYKFKIIRDILDKTCIDSNNSIELLKLGNTEKDWYFFFYISSSIDVTNDQTNLNSSIEILDDNTQEKFKLVLGLSDTNQLESEFASIIKGSIILNGLGYNEYTDGLSANISLGDDLDTPPKYYIKNIKKTILKNIYNIGFVTVISFLEQFNMSREYITIGETACNLSKEDYQYKLNIKKLLIDINNFNNINNTYISTTDSVIHTGQLNIFVTGNDLFITESGEINNSYDIEYFTFNKDSKKLSYFEINNNIIKNINSITGLDSRYIIVRCKDLYTNIVKTISINDEIISYDEHFIISKRKIQEYNENILSKFLYGDILVSIEDSSIIETSTNTTPTTPNTGTSTVNSSMNIIEQTKDSTNTGSLILQNPSKIEIEIFGPNNYFTKINSNTTFKNLVPGIYIIRGNDDSLKLNNLYQNELRISVSKNITSTATAVFSSYTNKLFIKDQ